VVGCVDDSTVDSEAGCLSFCKTVTTGTTWPLVSTYGVSVTKDTPGIVRLLPAGLVPHDLRKAASQKDPDVDSMGAAVNGPVGGRCVGDISSSETSGAVLGVGGAEGVFESKELVVDAVGNVEDIRGKPKDSEPANSRSNALLNS
jgi:hypothetical protein